MDKTKLILLGTIAFLLAIVFACSNGDDDTSSSTSVTALVSGSATFSSTATINAIYSGTATLPYTGGNGTTYSAGTAISSTGVTGLTATLTAGTLANGDGTLTYTITGTPTSSGVASFTVTFGGQTAMITLTVNSVATADCSSATGTAKLICLCDAFKATLTTSQIATLQLAYTYSNIKTWSNLPAAMSPRLGLKFSTLTASQLVAAKAIVKEMSGTTVNEGYDEVQQLWLADDYLSANGGGNDYGAGNYYIAFFGTPSSSGTFEIMMTGHHKTVANTYKDAALIAATPHFAAIEPLSFTTNGTTYAPINQEKVAFAAILASLSTIQLTSAKSSSTFSDLLLGPNANWSFPTTKSGLICSELTAAQKTLVTTAIKTYTDDIDDTNASKILAIYTAELDNTYILYSGTTALETKNDYVRIDGPHVWIEFSVQNGVIMSGVHHHSVWRDRVNDYGTTKN